jgi:hypothetical protein
MGIIRPIVIGPSAIPKSIRARKVPRAVPSEEPAYSRAYAMDTGKMKATPVPQSNPTKINRGRVVEKESMTMASIDVRINVSMILSLLQVSRIFPPRALPMMTITALAEKK